MLHSGVVQTRDILPHVEALFEGVDPKRRGTVTIYGKTGIIRRDAVWFGELMDGMYPLYRTFNNAYGPPSTTAGIAQATPPKPMPEWMSGVLRRLEERLGTPKLNHVVLHRYVDGNDVISDHRDKYMDIAPGSDIVSLSLGATRDFRIDRTTFPVRDGDAVVIPYDLNKRATHGVPRRARQRGTRYSITARTIDTHFDPTRRTFRHRKSRVTLPY